MEPPKIGRPTIYSKELANEICKQLSQGISLRTVCKADDMPDASVIFDWLHKYPEFTEQYTRAKEESADAMSEDILEISDDSLSDAMNVDPKSSTAVVQAHKLRVDTRKWLMSKMKPKKYADKLDLTNNGKDFPTPIYGGASTK